MGHQPAFLYVRIKKKDKEYMGLSRKLILVINGKGGCGKDTICNIVAKRYKTINISEITPIKEIASVGGWKGEKTDKARKFLADLKALFVDYNNLPYEYALGYIKDFINDDNEILFIHAREPEEIAKLVNGSPYKVNTILIRREDKLFTSKRHYGNHADDDVENYPYDFIYEGHNDSEEALEKDFMDYFENNLLKNLD